MQSTNYSMKASGNINVTVRDESFPRSEVVEMLLSLSSSGLTAKELIGERVRAECDRKLIDRSGNAAIPLVQVSEEETVLNGVRQERGRFERNPERQIERALKAFEENGFILLIDDTQIEALDAEVPISPDTVVTFLRLTPLVGG